MYISGEALKTALLDDPVNPVLLDDHFAAVDRRVDIILQAPTYIHMYIPT
jgi:hypothetical protein